MTTIPASATITLTLPDGSQREYPRGTTGRDVAASIGKRLAADALAIKVNGQVRDLSRPIELALILFTHPAAGR